MVEDKVHTKKLAPRLRFKAFNDSWIENKLGDVGKVKMCKRIFNNETSDSGDVPFYKIGTFGKQADAYITKELYLEYKNKFSFPKVGDILMSASGTLGRTVIYDGSPSYFQDSNIVWIDNNGKIISNEFLYIIYQIVRYNSEGGTIQRLYNNIISSAKFYRPSLPEQQKIASFLSAVDEKIQLLTRKKELVEKYKKGVMQKLFSGELRFKNEKGNDFPQWEEKRLGEVCESIKSGKSKATETGNYPLYGSTGIIGNCEEFSNNGQFILIARVGANAGTINLVSDKFGVSDNTLILYNKSILDTKYIYFYLLYFNLNKLIFGSGQPLITGGQLKELQIPFPVLIEQKKIADFLSSIDSKIEIINKQIAQTQEFKKGLLQQMFV